MTPVFHTSTSAVEEVERSDVETGFRGISSDLVGRSLALFDIATGRRPRRPEGRAAARTKSDARVRSGDDIASSAPTQLCEDRLAA